MTIPFGIVTVRDQFSVCLGDEVMAAGIATMGDRENVASMAAAFADAVRSAVLEVAAVTVGSPVVINLSAVVGSLVNSRNAADADMMIQSLIDRHADAPLLVAAYLDGGEAAVGSLVEAWLGDLI